MGQPYRLMFELELLPTIDPNAHRNWGARSRETKHIRGVIDMVCRLKGLPQEPLTSAHVRMTRFSASQPDGDNLADSFKAVLDALKEWVVPGKVRGAGVISDDDPDTVQLEYVWKRRKRGHIMVEVEA